MSSIRYPLSHKISALYCQLQGFVPNARRRDTMVTKYMTKTGLSREAAAKEVDEYLADKDAVSIPHNTFLLLIVHRHECICPATILI